MKTSLPHLWNFCSTHRYWLASFLLLAVMTSYTLYENHGDKDFWEHSAVVKELATHPLSPQHPLFNLDAPHVFFSPYLLSIGLLARAGDFTAIDALAYAGVFNLAYLLMSLRLFIQVFFDKFQDAIGFYALILILFLWPASAWQWSGFIHFKVLGLVLPYPSTFAIATTFFLFALFHHALTYHKTSQLLIIVMLSTVVLLTHPVTAVVMLIGIFSISLHFYNEIGGKALGIGLGIFIGTALLAFVWPYYSFFDLITFNGNPTTKFHWITWVMYKRIWLIWPILFLLPFALPLLLHSTQGKFF